jgi:hypothetical protein
VTWTWDGALLGASYAAPAALVAAHDVSLGMAFGVGVLPAAIVGVAPRRRARVATVALGVAAGVPLLLGAVVGNVPVLAVATIVGLGVAAAWLASRRRLGQVVLTVSLPMVGIGLSYHRDLGEAAGLAAIIVAGSVYAWLVSLLWPERPAPPGPGEAAGPTLGYGLRVGLAGASAAAIGFALDLEHVGWATAAALLVMRPSAEMQRLRSVGRVLAVIVGAILGSALVRADPPLWCYSVAVIVTIAGVSATRTSRWYITAGFTTFLVFIMLLYANPQTAESRFNERVVETLLGVGMAYVFGLAVPALERRRNHRT